MLPEIIVNPYNGEVLAIVSEILTNFAITADKLLTFLASDYYQNSLWQEEGSINHISFVSLLQEWLDNYDPDLVDCF